MISLEFDEILNFLTEIPKTELFLFNNEENSVDLLKEEFKFILNLKKEVSEIKITNTLLKNLEIDYEQCISKISLKLENFKN